MWEKLIICCSLTHDKNIFSTKHDRLKFHSAEQNDEYKRIYAVEVKNQYETLSKEETDQGSDLEVIECTWHNKIILKTSMVQAAKKVQPSSRRRHLMMMMMMKKLSSGLRPIHEYNVALHYNVHKM